MFINTPSYHPTCRQCRRGRLLSFSAPCQKSPTSPQKCPTSPQKRHVHQHYLLPPNLPAMQKGSSFVLFTPLSKEPYISAKVPYIFAKETCSSTLPPTTQLAGNAEGVVFCPFQPLVKRALHLRKSALHLCKRDMFINTPSYRPTCWQCRRGRLLSFSAPCQKSPISPQKCPTSSQKRRVHHHSLLPPLPFRSCCVAAKPKKIAPTKKSEFLRTKNDEFCDAAGNAGASGSRRCQGLWIRARNRLGNPCGLTETCFAAHNGALVRAVFHHSRGSYFSGGQLC